MIFIFLFITQYSSSIYPQTSYSYDRETSGVELHDSTIAQIRAKCVKSYLLYKHYYNVNPYPYKKLTRRFVDFSEVIPDTVEGRDSSYIQNTSSGFWIWPYLSAYLLKTDDSKIFKNYSAFYVYDSIYQFHGVIAVNDTDHTNIKLLGGQIANIDYMFDELSAKGIDSLDHLIGPYYPYSKKYLAGRGKIRLSNLTTSLEFYTKILSRSFDPSFFGYAVYNRRYSYVGGPVLTNYWVNYHRGKTNYKFYRNGEYEIIVSTDLFVVSKPFKTRKFEEAKRQCIFVSTDYPYATFEGWIPAEIIFRINPTKKTIRVKISEVKDINTVPECFLQQKR